MDIDQLLDPEGRSRRFTTDQITAAFGVLLAIGDTIQQLGSVPSGELYARVMDKMDLRTYNAVIRKLKDCGLVEEKSNLLKWIGPAKKEAQA